MNLVSTVPMTVAASDSIVNDASPLLKCIVGLLLIMGALVIFIVNRFLFKGKDDDFSEWVLRIIAIALALFGVYTILAGLLGHSFTDWFTKQ